MSTCIPLCKAVAKEKGIAIVYCKLRVGALADAVMMVEEQDWRVEERGESYVVAWTIGCSLFMATPPPPHYFLSYHCM